MIFEETKLKGSFIIKPERLEDERGFFARSFCLKEFAEHSLYPLIVQCNISYNKKKGTFRGMHFQAPPFEEDKIITCTQGAVLDYIVDLRAGSPTFKQWVAVELSADNRHIFYVPKLFAHGFITLLPETQVFYQMTQYYNPESARGFRWDDPAFDIHLPFPVEAIAEKDASFPPFEYPAILFAYGKQK